MTDALHDVEVSIIPSVGNRAYKMLVRGQNILHSPFENPSELKTDRHLSGIPFLAPWANRMPAGFHAEGGYYPFNPKSEALRLDGNGIPIHGMLTSSPHWQVTELKADSSVASVTSRLEFWRHPELMANWPFAHDYEMTYRLAEGMLEIRVVVINRSTGAMPVAVGFHPYFVLPGVPIAEAVAEVPVRSHVEMDSRLIPTGELTPVTFTNLVALDSHHFDDGFTDLIVNAEGRANFSVAGAGKKIEVIFGPNYPVAIVYAPPGQNYICFEPMSAITNGINLAHEGKYAGLQILQPGDKWEESFWIRATGF